MGTTISSTEIYEEVAEEMELIDHHVLASILIYEEMEELGRRKRLGAKMNMYVRVLEAVAAARAPEELLGEADVAAHGADGGGGGAAGHGESERRGRKRARERDRPERGGGWEVGSSDMERKAGPQEERGVGVKYERDMGGGVRACKERIRKEGREA